MFYATVRGMVLYLHKNDRGFEGSQYETFHNCVMLHHAIAEVPKDYTKRQNVFRLRTANFGELLFQAAEKLEMTKVCRQLCVD
jgi:PH/SEC7 domain-containing protein